MRKKTALIAFLVIVLIGVIGILAYLVEGNREQRKELLPILPKDSEIEIIGRVLGTSPSLKGIYIIRDGDEEQVFTIALDDDTQLFSVSGGQISLQDIRPGMRIKAIGKSGELLPEEGMLARKVWVLPD